MHCIQTIYIKTLKLNKHVDCVTYIMYMNFTNIKLIYIQDCIASENFMEAVNFFHLTVGLVSILDYCIPGENLNKNI